MVVGSDAIYIKGVGKKYNIRHKNIYNDIIEILKML